MRILCIRGEHQKSRVFVEGNVDTDFNASALKHLKTGENTLAITTLNNWRWGHVVYVYNDGFGFRLDGRKK